MPKFDQISWRGNFVEAHSFRTRKSGEITAFHSVNTFQYSATIVAEF